MTYFNGQAAAQPVSAIMLSNGLHNLGRKRNKAMVSSLSATDRARVLFVWQVRIAVGGWMPVVAIVLVGSSSSLVPRAHPHCVRPQVQLHTASRRCAAFDRPPVAIFSPEIGFLPRVAQLSHRVPLFLPFRFSGKKEERKNQGGWDRWVDLKIVRFPDPFWDFALLSLSLLVSFFRVWN